MKHRQHGFGSLELLLILVIIGIIGGVGWFVVRNSSIATETENSTVARRKTTPTPKPTEIALPDDWQWFTSQRYPEVKFAYPKSWGNLPETAVAEEPPYVGLKDREVRVRKKTDMLIQIPKGFADPTWYAWSGKTDALTAAQDKADMEVYGGSNYTEPVSLGEVTDVEPMYGEHQPYIFHVLGKGAMNCGTRHYFFAVGEYAVQLASSSCDRGGEWEPSDGQTYTDETEKPLQEFYKYIAQ